ncbi:MAG: ABC transporter substrate-binding protein [Actinomycetota bacterium]|nr:ABC transporter substrate-binding protein [Actinomycetota bacterium]
MCPTLIRTLVACSLPAALLVACGSESGDAGADAGSSPSAAADPIVVDHVYGSTEVGGVPERIVSLDSQWTDSLLALGVEPVGYAVDSYMPDSTVPWQDLPEGAAALDVTNGPPIEEIAALEPDLIVGSYTITDERTYDLLSGIAPTVPSFDEQDVTPWQQLVGLTGDLLDRPDDAAQLVEDVDAEVAAAASTLPQLKGQTFALAQYIVGDSMYIVADEEDGSTVFFEQLGMTMSPAVKAEGERTGETRVQVSTERADLLRADLLAFLVNGGDESDLDDIPGFDELPGTVAVLDYPTIVGLNTPSPLSVPYALEKLRPYLEEAAQAG